MKLNVDDSIKDNSFHAFSKASAAAAATPCGKFVYPFFLLLFLLLLIRCTFLISMLGLDDPKSAHFTIPDCIEKNFAFCFFFRESIICFLPFSDYPFTELPSCSSLSLSSIHNYQYAHKREKFSMGANTKDLGYINFKRNLFVSIFELISFINLLKK